MVRFAFYWQWFQSSPDHAYNHSVATSQSIRSTIVNCSTQISKTEQDTGQANGLGEDTTAQPHVTPQPLSNRLQRNEQS